MPPRPSRQAIQTRVAQLLREERLKKGLSMNALAAKAGLSLTMVSHVEREMRRPTLDTLLRLTEALGVDLVDILWRATKRR